jgi:TonB family protein
VQAVFPEAKSGTANVFAALRPKQHGFYLSSADEGKKFATLAALSGVLTEPALASLSPCEYTAVYARDGLTISGQGAPWLLAAAAKESYAQALATLQELKLVPTRISPATLSAAGGLASALKLKGDDSTALLFEFGEISTHLLLVSRNGVEAVRPTAVTMDKVAEAVQVELGLKFKGSAAKLFFNESYDFSETGAKIAARIAQELMADIEALGQTPAAFACTGLPAKQNWFANHLAGALNLAPFAPDLKSWSAQAHLTFTDNAQESSLTPAWLGFLHLIGNYQVASPEKSVWQPDWTRTTPPPAAAAAPVPATVIAPPKPAPAAFIAPPKPAATVPPAPARPTPSLFTPIAPKPATPATAIPPAKPGAATVPPATPARPAPPLFTPTPPKPATPAATTLPVKPAAPAPAPAKPATPPAKPIAAPPPRPIAAPPPKPVAAPAPAKPAPAPAPTPKPAAPTPLKPIVAPSSFAAKPSFLKSTAGMITIAAAALVLIVVVYFVYAGQQKAAKEAAEQIERQRHDAEEAAKIKQLADQKAQEDAALQKMQEDAAAKLAAAQAETKAAEERASIEEAAHLAAARGQINIATEPADATITIGNLPPRTSPALFTNLKIGRYPVTISLPNYETANLTIVVKENETADPGVVRLAHQTGSLELTSEPPGANYSVRSASNMFLLNTGGLSGATPATVNDLPSGDYIVTFSHEGFQSHSETVTVTHDTPAQASWKFVNGDVLITSTPSGATVTTSDGKVLGVTPVTLNDVEPGDVSYVLNLDGYDSATVSGKIEGGKTNTLSASLLSVDRLAKLSELDAQPQPIEQPQPQLSSRVSDSGVVEIAITVDRSGNPKDLEVVKNTTNNEEIARLCLAAVAKWRFKPGLIDDKPVNVRVTVPFTINP